jgi:hypothetical protein
VTAPKFQYKYKRKRTRAGRRIKILFLALGAQTTKTQKALELMRSNFEFWQVHFDKTCGLRGRTLNM